MIILFFYMLFYNFGKREPSEGMEEAVTILGFVELMTIDVICSVSLLSPLAG